MDKSQLRLLARDFASGDLNFADYRRQRDGLIDDIVAGVVDIERVPTATPPTAAELPQQPNSEHAKSSRPLSGQSILVGLVVLGLVAWLLYPATVTVPKFVPVQQPEQVAVREAPGPGERIVTEFLRAKAWGNVAVGQFLAAWVALTTTERREARQAGGIQQLTEALNQEMNTRQAVYDLAPSTDKKQALETLYELAVTLDITAAVPEPRTMVTTLKPETAATASIKPAVDLKTVDSTVAQLTVEPVASATQKTITTLETTTPLKTESPEETFDQNAGLGTLKRSKPPSWKAPERSTGYTLQLFALSDAANVTKVLSTYPTLDLRVLTLATGGARHRIVYGSFSEQAAATAAYHRLPTELTRGQPTPIIKSISEMRELL